MSQESRPTTSSLVVPETGLSKIISNYQVGPDWFVLRLEEPAIAKASKPGQFVQVLCSEPGSTDPLLRRPFSVYDVDKEKGTYDILYTTVGRGTRWMAQLPEEGAPLPTEENRRGEGLAVDVIGPFGNHFALPEEDDQVILVGGGVGVAPLYFFSKELCQKFKTPPSITMLMGARRKDLLQGIDAFRQLPIRNEVATNDGSEGFKGFVTQLLEELLDGPYKTTDPQKIKLYGCGPTGMNEALRQVALGRGIPCEICLEARMACGFGICFACVVPIKKELGGDLYNRRICLEGPVFDARLLGEGLGERPLDGKMPQGPICPTIS